MEQTLLILIGGVIGFLAGKFLNISFKPIKKGDTP